MIKIDRPLTAKEQVQVSEVINFMLEKIGVEGLIALKEVYQESPTKRAIINKEVNARKKAKGKQRGGFKRLDY